MNLQELQRKVKEKESKHNQLLGQKEMLEKQLKELGFNTIKEAQKEMDRLKKEEKILTERYDKGVSLFVSKYSHLL